jgi:hypothetical protein
MELTFLGGLEINKTRKAFRILIIHVYYESLGEYNLRCFSDEDQCFYYLRMPANYELALMQIIHIYLTIMETGFGIYNSVTDLCKILRGCHFDACGDCNSETNSLTSAES